MTRETLKEVDETQGRQTWAQVLAGENYRQERQARWWHSESGSIEHAYSMDGVIQLIASNISKCSTLCGDIPFNFVILPLINLHKFG